MQPWAARFAHWTATASVDVDGSFHALWCLAQALAQDWLAISLLVEL